MFGYVLVDKMSLRIREYEYYRATYCGLCHAMGKCTGCISRLSLSYDMTFFALLRESIDGTEVKIEKKRCIRHPLRAVNTVLPNPQLEYSAYAGGILTSRKLTDDVNDERGAKRALAALLHALFSGAEKRSDKALPLAAGFVAEGLARISDIEKKKTPSIDEPADAFGEIMSRLLALDLEGEREIVARSVGKRLGRWIYIVDAFDDYERDAKSGSYNPFVELYGKDGFDEDNIKSISSMLEAELSLALDALDLLEIDGDVNRREIIRNILCLGMPGNVKRICERRNKATRNGDADTK